MPAIARYQVTTDFPDELDEADSLTALLHAAALALADDGLFFTTETRRRASEGMQILYGQIRDRLDGLHNQLKP